MVPGGGLKSPENTARGMWHAATVSGLLCPEHLLCTGSRFSETALDSVTLGDFSDDAFRLPLGTS